MISTKYMIELGLILVLGGSLRFLFILSSTTDHGYHLRNIKWVKENGFKFPLVSDSIVCGRNIYPPLPHWIISLFPRSRWNAVGRILNIVYDLFSIIIIYIFSTILFEKGSWFHQLRADWMILSPGGWVTLLYSTSPLLFPITARLKTIGGRTLGHMLTNLYLAIMGYAIIFGNHWLLIACIPVGIAAILASIFAMQTLILYSLFLSVFLFDFYPVLTIFCVIAVGIILPGLHIRTLFLQNFYHYKWYLRSIKRGSPIENRNTAKTLMSLPRDLIHNKMRFVRNLFENNSFFIAIYSLPALIPVLYWTIASNSVSTEGHAYPIFFIAMLFSSIAIFLLTSFWPLIILGQAERYLESVSPYIMVLLLVHVVERNLFFLLSLFFLINFVFIIANFILIMGKEYLSQLVTKPDDKLKPVLEMLGNMREPRIMTIPTRLAYIVSTYLDHNNASYCYDWITQDGSGYQYMIKERERYQYPMTNLRYYTEKYKVNTFIVSKKSLAKARDQNIQYDFSKSLLLMENDLYMVYGSCDNAV